LIFVRRRRVEEEEGGTSLEVTKWFMVKVVERGITKFAGFGIRRWWDLEYFERKTQTSNIEEWFERVEVSHLLNNST
jgi:hypothetical protein